MSEFDVLLRETLGRLAEPGDPTGVVEAIRARLDAAGPSGDGGPGGAGGIGGGGSFWSGSFWSGWAPVGGLSLLAATGGVALGLGLAPASVEAAADPSKPLAASRSAAVPGAACPGGAAIAALDPGARVLALARDEDGAHLAVRDPAELGSVVWVASDSAVVDPGADVDALPIWGCGEATEIAGETGQVPAPGQGPTPQPSAEPVPGSVPAPGSAPGSVPGPAPAPQPPADTQQPTIQVGGWSESYICTVESAFGPQSASISISVGDNVGVTSVTATSPTPGVSLSGPSGSGATRTFTVSRSGTTDTFIQVAFSVKDAAGNEVTGNAPDLDSVGPWNCIG